MCCVDALNCIQAKVDAPSPTRVLFISSLPSDVTEGDVVQLGLPFGRMTNLILNKKKYNVGHKFC
jgi:hypothetical protein